MINYWSTMVQANFFRDKGRWLASIKNTHSDRCVVKNKMKVLFPWVGGRFIPLASFRSDFKSTRNDRVQLRPETKVVRIY